MCPWVTKRTESGYFSLGYTLWLYPGRLPETDKNRHVSTDPKLLEVPVAVVPHHCHDFLRFLSNATEGTMARQIRTQSQAVGKALWVTHSLHEIVRNLETVNFPSM